MSDFQYNLQFEKLCDALKLGKLVNTPAAVSGGLLHRMFAIETTHGKYAVKALNPQIMLRPEAMQNIINSELIANIAAKTISALPAKKFNSTFIQEMDNQFYLVFDWVEGRSLKPNEISVTHCKEIGAVLADIHTIDFSGLKLVDNYSAEEKLIDWNFYLQKGKESNADWVALLNESIDGLYTWNSQLVKASKLLAANTIISHGDLDPKNVMWNKDIPLLIDWEAAGFLNPMYDLLETAVYWSMNETEDMDKERFDAFIRAYKAKCPIRNVDWKTVLAKGYSGKIGWLEYSLKRSLQIECADEAEQKLGTAHVTGTIESIRRYAHMIPELEKWLNNEV